MSDHTISSKHLVLVSSAYIEKFIIELDQVLSDPGYPDQVLLLTESFKKLAQKGLFEIQNHYQRYNSADTIIGSISNLNPLYKEKYINSEKDVSLKQIKLIYKYFKYLSGLIRYILSSSIETAPLGLIFPFQRIVDRFYPKSYIFLRRQWKHNFKYGEFVNQILDPAEKPDYFDDIKDEFNFRLSMVAYPCLEDDNYLYNCNIGHEIGHYIDDLNRFAQKEKAFLKEVPLGDYQTEELNVETEIRKISLDWHEEFIADVYATFLLGPAYLSSFLEFHGDIKELDQIYIGKERNYPSVRMRLFYIIKTLQYDQHNVKLHCSMSSKDWFQNTVKKIEEYEQLIRGNLYVFDSYDKNGIIDQHISKLQYEEYLIRKRIEKVKELKREEDL